MGIRSAPRISLFLLLTLLASCSVSRPCSEGGDVSWNPKIIGDKKCAQVTLKDGRQLDDGDFKQYYQTTGTIALEGQFNEGRKTGIWLYYGEDTQLRSVKYFDHGVEKTPPLEVQKDIDRVIQQKAGMR
jgi:hypothetical protein